MELRTGGLLLAVTEVHATSRMNRNKTFSSLPMAYGAFSWEMLTKLKVAAFKPSSSVMANVTIICTES